MKKPSTKPTEHKCPACNGTGYPVVTRPVRPGRKIYPAPCKKCGGKGRITEDAYAGRKSNPGILVTYPAQNWATKNFARLARRRAREHLSPRINASVPHCDTSFH